MGARLTEEPLGKLGGDGRMDVVSPRTRSRWSPSPLRLQQAPNTIHP